MKNNNIRFSAGVLSLLLLLLSSCGTPPQDISHTEEVVNDYATILISPEAKSQGNLERPEGDFYAFVRKALRIENPADLAFVPGSMRIETTNINDVNSYKYYLAGLVKDLPEDRLKYYRLELLETDGALQLVDRPNNLIVVKTCYTIVDEEDCGYEDAFREDGNVKFICACKAEDQVNEEYYLGERKASTTGK